MQADTATETKHRRNHVPITKQKTKPRETEAQTGAASGRGRDKAKTYLHHRSLEKVAICRPTSFG